MGWKTQSSVKYFKKFLLVLNFGSGKTKFFLVPKFGMLQCRKDIERAFGVLQSRFAIVRGPARFWDKQTLKNIMTCCVILHNMIIEDERGLNLDLPYDNVGSRVKPDRNPDCVEAFLQTYREIENEDTHKKLQLDLVEHTWQLHGQ